MDFFVRQHSCCCANSFQEITGLVCPYMVPFFYWAGFSSFLQDRWLSSKSTIELILIPFSALRPSSC